MASNLILRSASRSFATSSAAATTSLPCSFYRGGTSKGLLWSTALLAHFRQDVRDKIICSAMGSPDPDRRQINGLGGGISSLSKTAIVGPPDAALASQLKFKGQTFAFKNSVEWADEEQLARDPIRGWDVVYRFGQVPVESGTEIDWTSTCGNLVSAVALFALHSGAVPQQRIQEHFASTSGEGNETTFPVRILVASSGQIIRANVPVNLGVDRIWAPAVTGETIIAGVPGTAPGILIETPLKMEEILPTGNQVDTVTVGGVEYPVTIINAGLPTIFVSSSSIPDSTLAGSDLPKLTPSQLDANAPLMALLDHLRNASAALNPFLTQTLSPSAPKICIVHPPPQEGYSTTGGVSISHKEMDLLIRAVSVGNIHRTVPATCLSALACGRAFPDSTIQQSVQLHGQKEEQGIRSITVGQPAGLSEASIRVDPDSGMPESIVYYRTARRIIRGAIDVPPGLV